MLSCRCACARKDLEAVFLGFLKSLALLSLSMRFNCLSSGSGFTGMYLCYERGKLLSKASIQLFHSSSTFPVSCIRLIRALETWKQHPMRLAASKVLEARLENKTKCPLNFIVSYYLSSICQIRFHLSISYRLFHSIIIRTL